MRLLPDDPIFGKTLDDYESPFPSDDSMLDVKYNMLLSKKDGDNFNTIGEKLSMINQGRAFSSALAIANKTKSTTVGDLLTDWLPKTAWMEGRDNNLVRGLFATVPWKAITSLNVESIALAMTDSGLNIAMTALSAIPIYGQIASGILKAGTALFNIMSTRNSGQEYSLPFSEYSRDSDEDRIRLANDIIFNSTNWTDLFRPPFEINAPWKIASVDRKSNRWGKTFDVSGFVFIPTMDNQPAWNDSGWGCMPGTFRVLGQIQQSKQEFPLSPELNRKINSDYHYPWKYKLINCGDYFPSLAQLGAAIWQQSMTAGNPDMYKINTYQLEYEWEAFFQNLYSTANYEIDHHNLGVSPALGASENVASQMVEPFLCYKFNKNDDSWTWGTPNFFRPNQYYHKEFFSKNGKYKGPVPLALRNSCLFVEEDLKKGKNHFWPYSTNQKQLTDYLANSPVKPATKNPPKGYRCISFPTKEDSALIWSNPYDAIIKPAILALRARQIACLKSTLVCAYTSLEYAAFKNTGNTGLDGLGKILGLIGLHTDMQQTLLNDNARFVVNLKDVKSINPTFEKKLTQSGVNNSVSQMSTAKFGLKSAIGNNNTDPIPDAPANTGGIPFGDLTLPKNKTTTPKNNNLITIGAIAGAGYLLLNRKS
jgi:hypothetical protein